MLTHSCVSHPSVLSPRLIAITRGVLPYADPLVCGDLTGPNSLFGEGVRVPRPLSMACNHNMFSNACCKTEDSALLASAVLWDSKNEKSCDTYAVDYVTYLTGAVTSTFDVAWHLASLSLLSDWAGVVSTTQKQGHGQLKRHWYSPAGNLHVSFMLPEDPIFSSSAGAIVVGYIVVKALRALGYNVVLKWPNDILTEDGKKVAGLLIKERSGQLIAGLGVNLCETPPIAEMREGYSAAPGVLLPVNNKDDVHAPFFFWQTLVTQLNVAYNTYVARQELTAVLDNAQEHLAWVGKRLVVHDNGEMVARGRCLGFAVDGGLCLCDSNNEMHQVTFGSVSLVD